MVIDQSRIAHERFDRRREPSTNRPNLKKRTQSCFVFYYAGQVRLRLQLPMAQVRRDRKTPGFVQLRRGKKPILLRFLLRRTDPTSLTASPRQVLTAESRIQACPERSRGKTEASRRIENKANLWHGHLGRVLMDWKSMPHFIRMGRVLWGFCQAFKLLT